VERVDFVPLTQEKPNMHSAFVHCIYVNELVAKYVEESHSFRLPIPGNKYWILLKNKNPVAATRLNIHQVVENARLLELKVTEQQETIVKQTEQIQRMQETMNIVLARVFDTKSEFNQIYNNYNYMMYGKNCDTRWLVSEDDEELTMVDDCSLDSELYDDY